MKKIITTSAVVAVLLTSVQANFDFGDVFKDLKDTKITMSNNAKESTIKVSVANFDFGDVFKDLKDEKTTMSNKTKESTSKVSVAEFDFGDVFKDLKDTAQ